MKENFQAECLFVCLYICFDNVFRSHWGKKMKGLKLPGRKTRPNLPQTSTFDPRPMNNFPNDENTTACFDNTTDDTNDKTQ